MGVEYSLRIKRKGEPDNTKNVVEEMRFMARGPIQSWYPSYEAQRREYDARASSGSDLEVVTVRLK